MQKAFPKDPQSTLKCSSDSERKAKMRVRVRMRVGVRMSVRVRIRVSVRLRVRMLQLLHDDKLHLPGKRKQHLAS